MKAVRLSLAFLWICLLSDLEVKGNPCTDPCTDGNYQHLNEGDRSISATGTTDKCDGHEITNWSAWYRVSGDAGNALASKNAPPTNSCRSEIPVYLKDDHPSFSEGEVTRKACSATKNDQCNRENDIQVINCGAFYLYNLVRWRECKSQNKNWRYCTNGLADDKCDGVSCSGGQLCALKDNGNQYECVDGNVLQSTLAKTDTVETNPICPS